MKVALLIDTSLSGVAVAASCFTDTRVTILHAFCSEKQRAAESELAKHTALILQELPSPEKIIVSVGPGSFTGIRIGMSFALGLATGAAQRLQGVSSLRCIAKRFAADFAPEGKQARLYLRLTTNYGVVAYTCAEMNKEMNKQVQLSAFSLTELQVNPCNRHIIVGAWQELSHSLREQGVAHDSIELAQMLRYSLQALAQESVNPQDGVNSAFQPMYLREPYC